MPEKLGYPFKHHTKLKDKFFNDLKSYYGEPLTADKPDKLQDMFPESPGEWEKGKTLFNDMYVDFCIGLLSFMDGNLVLPGNSPEVAAPKIEAQFEEFVKTDKPAFFFLPVYRDILSADFPVLFSENTGEITDKSCDAAYAYDQVVFACSHRFWNDYANVYRKEDLVKFINLLCAKYFPCPDKDEFIAELKDCNLVNRSNPEDVAGVYKFEQEFMFKQMRKLLNTEDEAASAMIKSGVDRYFSGRLPEIIGKMRSYYAKIRKIRKSIDDYWLDYSTDDI